MRKVVEEFEVAIGVVITAHSLQENPSCPFFVSSSLFPSSRLHNHRRHIQGLLLGLEIIQQNASLLAFLAPVSHHHTAAVDDLAGIALPIQHTQSGPFAQLLAVRDFDQGDLVFGAERDDEFLVGFFLAAFV